MLYIRVDQATPNRMYNMVFDRPESDGHSSQAQHPDAATGAVTNRMCNLEKQQAQCAGERTERVSQLTSGRQ